MGRIVKKEPPRSCPPWTTPVSFTRREGNFALDGVVLVVVLRSQSADSTLTANLTVSETGFAAFLEIQDGKVIGRGGLEPADHRGICTL
jgi:hypothetical protein